ncbi:hypothetical protein FTUN_8473 [Frigoriglobus tundricola]|uniref:Uncharacterized protein n=1 Tax=Frigoriglobus tundricola TaxID=2774151 RepID=A0A6M5Z551_9BACT|nr:hypothetical protein [Frigoriglobus tundricola]QJX00835.1 hypothetical protein FTUN_8473 [Frigoriglobus tundricola]
MLPGQKFGLGECQQEIGVVGVGVEERLQCRSRALGVRTGPLKCPLPLDRAGKGAECARFLQVGGGIGAVAFESGLLSGQQVHLGISAPVAPEPVQ